MAKAVSNTSPLLYLHRIGGLVWLGLLFQEVWIPDAVAEELKIGRQKGYDVPEIDGFTWLKRMNPEHIPHEWLASDLGKGELATLALAMEHRDHVILLDDLLARRIARAAGLETWGTLRVLLEAKEHRLIEHVAPYVERLANAGMWLSSEIRLRILRLADEGS